MHIDLRIGPQKLAEIGWQFVQADAIDSADPNGAGNYRADLAQFVFEFNKSAHDLLAGIIKNLTGRSRLYAGARSFQQTTFIFVFKAPHLLADGGLRNKIWRSGKKTAAALNNFAKDFWLFDVHNTLF